MSTIDELEWKKLNKPASCTTVPWAYLIPYKDRDSVLRQVKQETLDIYGYDFQECPKRMVCFTKACLGRPLEWKSPTARPYLELFAKQHNIPIEGEYFVKTCDTCPLAATCSKPCAQVNDYLNRGKTKDAPLVIKETTDNFTQEVVQDYAPLNSFKENMTVPWDALPARKAEVIKTYLYKQRDFKYIADTLNLNNQARAKYEFYAALTTLSEYAVMRKFIAENESELTKNQLKVLNTVYNENMSLTEAAAHLGITKQAVEQTISRVVKSYKLRWQKFVTKKSNRVIYNVPEVLK